MPQNASLQDESSTGPTPWDRREAGDDFFCLRYRVWYASIDCAFRTKFETCAGCANCEQGRFNYQRHRLTLAHARLPVIG